MLKFLVVEVHRAFCLWFVVLNPAKWSIYMYSCHTNYWKSWNALVSLKYKRIFLASETLSMNVAICLLCLALIVRYFFTCWIFMSCLEDILHVSGQEAVVKGRPTHPCLFVFCMLPILHDVAPVWRKMSTKHFQTKLFYSFFCLFALFQWREDI